MQPEIAVNYSLSFKEFCAGANLGRRQHPLIFLFYFAARYIAVLAGAFLLLLVIFSLFDGQRSSALYLLPAALLFLSIPLIVHWGSRSAFKRLLHPGANQANLSFEATPEFFTRRVEGMGDLTWRWDATQGFASNRKIIVIEARKTAFIFIPRHVLSDTQIERLRQLQKGQS